MVRKLIAGALSLALLGAVSSPSYAKAPCRDAKGKFIKCAEAKPKVQRCRDAKGKFAKCGTPGSKPA